MAWNGQRQDGVGARRVDVHLLAEAVAVEQERAGHARAAAAAAPGVERQRQLVARLRDHEAIVARADETPHVAFARVASGQRLPGRRARTRARSRTPTARARRGWPRPRSRARAGRPAAARGPRAWARTPRAGAAAAASSHITRIVVTTRTRRDGPSRPATSTTIVCGRPTGMPICSSAVVQRAVRALHLEPRRHELQARLVGGHVVAREGVVGPAGEQQQRVRLRQAGQVERERVLPRVAADPLQRQLVDEDAVEPAQALA